MGLHKAPHPSPHSHLCLSQRACGRALQSFASGCFGGFWYLLGMWGEAFPSLVLSQRAVAEDLMWRSAEVLRSQTILLRVTMRCLFFLLCYIQSSLHANVLSGCLFDEPIIYTESIFAFKLNIFKKAVLLLALYSSSLSSVRKTNHEKSLYFKPLRWNNFVLVFLKGERNVPPLLQL